MKEKINWLEQAVSLFVVFISITAGFLLNEYRADVYDEELELKYLQSFQDNLNNNLKELNTVIPKNKEGRDILQRYFNAMKRDSVVIDSALLVMQVMLTNSQFAYQTNTYEDIKNSGNLNLIKNFELKEAIVLYHANLQELKLLEEVYYDFSQIYAWPLALENLDFLHAKLIDEKVVHNLKFRNTTIGYYSVIIQRVDSYEKILEESETLKTLLMAEINARK